MIELARMAMQIAADRIWPGVEIANGAKPLSRTRVQSIGPSVVPLSAEYYRIIDRITRGEKP